MASAFASGTPISLIVGYRHMVCSVQPTVPALFHVSHHGVNRIFRLLVLSNLLICLAY
ncbi:MAG: hypothetical protein MO846_01955 [Candidatus Devosia symbiotica]|nr:hypothetical protein [Candidatus Devosia symbiotica]